MRALALALALLGTRAAAGQSVSNANVPAPVQQTLLVRFSDTRAVAWTIAKDHNYVAQIRRNGVDIKITILPTGSWVESSAEIGAVNLPDPVKKAVIGSYRGYQFAETRRVDRATAPTQIFEVHMARGGETTIARYDAMGKVVSTRSNAVPTKSLRVVGVWRGESICLAGRPACRDETVVYRITAAPSDSSAFDAQMNKLVAGREEETANLPCTFVRSRSVLYCTMPQGIWGFQLRGDSLVGGLRLSDSTAVRRVAVRRQR